MADASNGNTPQNNILKPGLGALGLAKTEVAPQAKRRGGGTDIEEFVALCQTYRTVINRDMAHLIRVAQAVGEQLKDDGYYRFPAGGKHVEGASVWLMDALAAEYGGLKVQIAIVDTYRTPGDDTERVVMAATVIDGIKITQMIRQMEYILAAPPAKFGKDAEQAARWRSMQLNSAASKTVRTTIEHALPAWYVSAGLKAAKAAFSDNILKNTTLAEVIAKLADAYEEMGITLEELSLHQKRDAKAWTTAQIVDLRDLYKSLKNGDVTVEEVFGAIRRQKAEDEDNRRKAATQAAVPDAEVVDSPAAPLSLPPPSPTAADQLGLGQSTGFAAEMATVDAARGNGKKGKQ